MPSLCLWGEVNKIMNVVQNLSILNMNFVLHILVCVNHNFARNIYIIATLGVRIIPFSCDTFAFMQRKGQ